MTGQEFRFLLPFGFGLFLIEILHAANITEVAAFAIHEHIGSGCRIHQEVLRRIGNGHGKAAGNSHGKEGGIDVHPVGQAEGNVGQAADRGQAQIFFTVGKGRHAVESCRWRRTNGRH